MKKILFIAGTHGDEKIGMEVITKLNKLGYQKYFDFLIGNRKAFEKNARFLEFDLNRAYPGNKFSKFYEKRLAYKNLKIAKKYRYIIDFHEASQGKNDFIIIPRNKISRKFPLNLIDLKTALLWPEPKGPLSQILPNSIELEFGMKNKNRKKVVSKATKIAKKFIDNLLAEPKNKFKKNIYFVYGKMLKGEIASGNVVDFRKIKTAREEFYPLLVDQYLDLGIKCYKMKRFSKAAKSRA